MRAGASSEPWAIDLIAELEIAAKLIREQHPQDGFWLALANLIGLMRVDAEMMDVEELNTHSRTGDVLAVARAYLTMVGAR